MKKKSAKTVPADPVPCAAGRKSTAGATARVRKSKGRQHRAHPPELEIHRIELEMQMMNSDTAKLEVETGLEKYTDLF